MKDDARYAGFALVREMRETPEIIRRFRPRGIEEAVEAVREKRRLLFTGEGSSRIFPAKNAIYSARRAGADLELLCEGARQAGEYDLTHYAVFAASNSGATREVIWLFERLHKIEHPAFFALTARDKTLLETLAVQTFVLSCGWEHAVPATKSVVEEGLFYLALLSHFDGIAVENRLPALAEGFGHALELEIDSEIVQALVQAPAVYFAGRNDGVAEELSLKANEITRKKSRYLEGTFLLHGVEEVMTPGDVVIVVNPYPAEYEKMREILAHGAGVKVIAVSDEATPFKTIKVPPVGRFQNFVYLAAGWNFLVETGLALGVNLDKPDRARKIGNEFSSAGHA